MARNRRDRDRTQCPQCGKTVTVRRDDDGRSCMAPAWQQRREATR